MNRDPRYGYSCTGCGYPAHQCCCNRDPRAREAERRYRHTPKGRYIRHKANAKRRGVEFLLTYQQWCEVWQDSGHWRENRPEEGFHMCRCGDVGPYALGNVYIGTKGENCAERNRTLAARRRTDRAGDP